MKFIFASNYVNFCIHANNLSVSNSPAYERLTDYNSEEFVLFYSYNNAYMYDVIRHKMQIIFKYTYSTAKSKLLQKLQLH